jgi:hypothetical protein
MSAGNDSRYALALLQRQGVTPKLLTFGHPESDEVRDAAAVCRRIGRDNELFQIPAGDWDAWERIIGQLGNAGMVQWSGWVEHWLDYLRMQGDNVVIGFLGDALSGNHFAAAPEEDADWIRYWIDFSTNQHWLRGPLLLQAARKRAQEAFAMLGEDSRGLDFAFPFQRALHLNFYGRQRRWTGAQPNLLSRAVLPILPFYRASSIAFWSNLPLADLRGQRLYLEYARSRFPRLFPAAPGRFGRFTSRAARKLSAIGRSVRGASDRRSAPVIDRSHAILPHRERILGLCETVRPRVAHLLDVDALKQEVRGFEGHSQSAAGLIIRATNAFQLVALACEHETLEPVAI